MSRVTWPRALMKPLRIKRTKRAWPLSGGLLRRAARASVASSSGLGNERFMSHDLLRHIRAAQLKARIDVLPSRISRSRIQGVDGKLNFLQSPAKEHVEELQEPRESQDRIEERSGGEPHPRRPFAVLPALGNAQSDLCVLQRSVDEANAGAGSGGSHRQISSNRRGHRFRKYRIIGGGVQD